MHGSENSQRNGKEENYKTLKYFYILKIRECDELKEQVVKLRRENEKLKLKLREMDEDMGERE